MEIAGKEARNEPPEEVLMLPEEIIMEVLSRLPVKSLCRFRCVCKRWVSLISDRQFAKDHLECALQNDNVFSRRRRLIISSYNLYSVECESINLHSDEIVGVELDYPLKDEPRFSIEVFFDDFFERGDHRIRRRYTAAENPRNWVSIVGSCNGLVCIKPNEEILLLFNPATRESKRIPNPSSEPLESIKVFGFGFDSVKEDFKLVAKLASNAVSLYSLRADSWREIGFLPYFEIASESGILLNRAVHWLATRATDNGQVCVIAAFDFAEEAWVNLPAPDVIVNVEDVLRPSYGITLGVFGGCLFVLLSHNRMRDEFWLMTEYGVAESWKRFTVITARLYVKRLCLARYGEVVLKIGLDELRLHNEEDDSFRDLVMIRDLPFDEACESYGYLETLISPNRYCRSET